MLTTRVSFACALRARRASTAAGPAAANSLEFDVLIAGGLGLVGSTMACALKANTRTRHLRVGVLDSAPLSAVASATTNTSPMTELPPPDWRVSAITPASVDVLERAGAWPLLSAARVKAFTQMQVWDSQGSGCMQFDAHSDRDAGAPITDTSPALGFIVENVHLQSALSKRVAALAAADAGNLHVLAASNIVAATAGNAEAAAPDDAWARVEVERAGGERVVLRARLVIAADGAQSRIRQLLGMSAHGFDYNQRGVVATVRTRTPHATAFQRFLPSGPLALLPSYGAYSSIVWSTNVTHAHRLTTLSSAELCDELNFALRAPPHLVSPQYQAAPAPFRQLLPPSLARLLPVLLPWTVDAGASNALAPHLYPPEVVEVCRAPQAFPLRLLQADRYTDARVALVGDAAHTVHPLAGQGLNIGIGDVARLLATLERAVDTGGDIGAAHVLRAYDRQQTTANTAMMGAIHGVQLLFQNNGALAALRNIGMDAINATPALKREIVAVAMGLRAPGDDEAKSKAARL